jgi:hypothetical protein
VRARGRQTHTHDDEGRERYLCELYEAEEANGTCPMDDEYNAFDEFLRYLDRVFENSQMDRDLASLTGTMALAVTYRSAQHQPEPSRTMSIGLPHAGIAKAKYLRNAVGKVGFALADSTEKYAIDRRDLRKRRKLVQMIDQESWLPSKHHRSTKPQPQLFLSTGSRANWQRCLELRQVLTLDKMEIRELGSSCLRPWSKEG